LRRRDKGPMEARIATFSVATGDAA
jgi:hypothetical protein